MISEPNIQAAIRDRANNNVWDFVGTGTPTSGTSGTGVGFAGPGSSYTNVSTGIRYTNTNLAASPTWTISGPLSAGSLTETMLVAASAFGLGAVRYAKSVWDFAVDGGTIGAISPVSGATLPNKAIILGGVLDIITQPVGVNGTFALGTSAGSAADSILAATNVSSLTVGVSVVLVPKFTAATIFKLTAAGVLRFTIATTNITAGKMGLTVAYLVGD